MLRFLQTATSLSELISIPVIFAKINLYFIFNFFFRSSRITTQNALINVIRSMPSGTATAQEVNVWIVIIVLKAVDELWPNLQIVL